MLGLITLPLSYGCTCSEDMCTNIPSDHKYYLTSFCDSSTACGKSCGDCKSYYAADYKRFGCGSTIHCCKGSKCVNLEIIDGGPACSVEEKAGKPIIDASNSACEYFTGSKSCGWSDKVEIVCEKKSSLLVKGPCRVGEITEENKNLPDCFTESLTNIFYWNIYQFIFFIFFYEHK